MPTGKLGEASPARVSRACSVGGSGMVEKVRVCEGVVFEVVDGEAVVLNLNTGIYFTLNRTGTRIWELITEHGDLESVRALMAEEYDAEPEQLAGDLERLAGELVDRGLVEAG